VKAEKIFVGVVSGFCLLLTIGGALLMYVGEWLERRKLPPEMQTPEAIQKYYDGAVCLACDLGGGVMILIGISSMIAVFLVWSLVEVARIVKTPEQETHAQRDA